jgi:hypothetical protein
VWFLVGYNPGDPHLYCLLGMEVLVNIADEIQQLYIADKTLEQLLVLDALIALKQIRNKYSRLKQFDSIWNEIDNLEGVRNDFLPEK